MPNASIIKDKAIHIPTSVQLGNGLLNWLGGSISLVNGAPNSFYHATPASFTQFRPFQHFGSLTAAQNRASHRSTIPHATIEVWLQITNPWMTLDDQGANNVGPLVLHALRGGAIDNAAYARINNAMAASQAQWAHYPPDHQAIKWYCNMLPFTQELAHSGYDGLVYQNIVEGDLSYIPFRSDQLWWTGRDDHEV